MDLKPAGQAPTLAGALNMKPKKKSPQRKAKKRLDEYCHACQLKRGAQVPKGNPNFIGITMHAGDCESCGKETGIVPSCDYDWPDGRKAILD